MTLRYLLTTILASSLLFCHAGSSQAAPKTGKNAEKVVVAYVTSWSEVTPDPKFMTHINYAFGGVNKTFDGVDISNPERLKMIAGLKKQAPELKVLLSIGGWGSGRFSEMAADTLLRASFAAACRRVVDLYNLDGIDIDWEYPCSPLAEIDYDPRTRKTTP